MRLKLDENFSRDAANFLITAGHDVKTVKEERLGGADDATVFAACVAEKRALITLDHDFGNVIRFPPATSQGIVVIELPPGQSPASMLAGLATFHSALKKNTLKNDLWIVEPGRIRIHQRDDLEDWP
jgi:hypothetical protein